LADLIHNFGDALTAIPLGIAFLLRSSVAEKRAGYFVVATIFVSACVAGVEAIDRLIHPRTLDCLWILAAAGAIGFIGNEIAAHARLRAGRALNSPALIADGNHARVNGFVSLSVVAGAIFVAIGFKLGDPLIGLAITLVILRITGQSIQTIKPGPGMPAEPEDLNHDDRHATPPAIGLPIRANSGTSGHAGWWAAVGGRMGRAVARGHLRRLGSLWHRERDVEQWGRVERSVGGFETRISRGVAGRARPFAIAGGLKGSYDLGSVAPCDSSTAIVPVAILALPEHKKADAGDPCHRSTQSPRMLHGFPRRHSMVGLTVRS
jgi:hypothetical protein